VIIEILLIYIFYLLIIVVGSYYVNLYLTKDQFTKDELKDIMPYLTKLWNRTATSYSLATLLTCLFAASIIGILLPMLSQHWFLNSAIIFIIMFFAFPLAKKNYDIARITTGGSFADTAMGIFVKYSSIILIGFGTGTATGIMYNWGAYKAIHFIWFLVNLIVLTIGIGMVIKDVDSQ